MSNNTTVVLSVFAVWFSVAVAVSAGIYFTGMPCCLGAFIIPYFVRIASTEKKWSPDKTFPNVGESDKRLLTRAEEGEKNDECK